MSDLTTQVLIDIRDEIRATNTRLDGVARRQAESVVRVTTELVGVRDAVDRVVDLLRADRSLRGDVDNLKERVATLERKTG